MRATGLLVDIDGVILRDDAPLPGAAELVRWLLESGSRFLFLTNYPSQTPADLAGRLAGAGIEVPARYFFTSAMPPRSSSTSRRARGAARSSLPTSSGK